MKMQTTFRRWWEKMFVFAIGFTEQPFDVVSIYCMPKISFGNTNNELMGQLSLIIPVVITFKGIADKTLLFSNQLGNLKLRTKSFCFRQFT